MRHRIVEILAFLAYWTGVNALFYWLNRKAKRIVTFHNVLPDALYTNDLANGVSNSESGFRLIVEEIAKKYRFSTDVWDAKTCTITFDDGYVNQVEVAGRVLDEMEIPAILFVAGDLIGGKGPLLVDKLLHETESVEKWAKEVWTKLRDGGYSRVSSYAEATEDEERGDVGHSEEYTRLRLTGANEDQLNELRARGWKIGWHTWRHLPLVSLSEDEVRKELSCPAEYRSEVLSYPFGNPEEVGDAAIRIAEELGYPCAVSNTHAAGAKHGRYFLPRMDLLPNKYMIHFELSGAKFWMMYKRLLPRNFV